MRLGWRDCFRKDQIMSGGNIIIGIEHALQTLARADQILDDATPPPSRSPSGCATAWPGCAHRPLRIMGKMQVPEFAWAAL